MIKTVLITGSARRIGAGIAKALANEGWHVCVHFNQSAHDAATVVSDIKAAGGIASAIQANLEEPAAASQLVEQCNKVSGPLTCLVNNASIFEHDGIENISANGLNRHHSVNLRAPMLLTSSFAEQLPEDQTGDIVNILDNKVFALNPDYLSYTISKIALTGATEALAMALAPRIKVNGIAPGLIWTAQALDPVHSMGPKGLKAAAKTVPLKRIGSADEIADVATFLVSEKARYVTGQIITVDGGFTVAI